MQVSSEEPMKGFLKGLIQDLLIGEYAPALEGVATSFELVQALHDGAMTEYAAMYSEIADQEPSIGVLIVERAYTVSGHFGYTEEKAFYPLGYYTNPRED